MGEGGGGGGGAGLGGRPEIGAGAKHAASGRIAEAQD
jgi:hypothetical protein